MEYTTEYNETDRICTLRVTGTYQRPDDALMLRHVALDLATERSYGLFLCDLTQAEIKGEWEEAVPAVNARDSVDDQHWHVKAAIVYSRDLSDNKLLESIASTKGYLIRMFDDIDEAIEWLKI